MIGNDGTPPRVDAPPRDPDRLSLVAGTLLAAFCLSFAAAVAFIALSRRHPPALLPVFAFAALMALGLAVLGATPAYRALRDRDLRRAWQARLSRCPACGLPISGAARCASCAAPLDDAARWWRLAPPLWTESVAGVLLGAGVSSLGVFGLAFARSVGRLGAAAIALAGLAVVAFGGMIAYHAARALRAQRGAPLELTFRRVWERGGATWNASASATLRDGRWRAAGSCEGPGDEPGDAPIATEDPFERGLARLLAGWHRDERAPLVCVTVARWSHDDDAPGGAVGAGGYREAARAEGAGPRRAVAPAWRVSFNAHGFGELIAQEGLPAGVPPPDDDDDDAAELGEADWDVDLPLIVRVIARDEALREAIAARGRAAGDDDAGVRRALRALRAG